MQSRLQPISLSQAAFRPDSTTSGAPSDHRHTFTNICSLASFPDPAAFAAPARSSSRSRRSTRSCSTPNQLQPPQHPARSHRFGVHLPPAVAHPPAATVGRRYSVTDRRRQPARTGAPAEAAPPRRRRHLDPADGTDRAPPAARLPRMRAVIRAMPERFRYPNAFGTRASSTPTPTPDATTTPDPTTTSRSRRSGSQRHDKPAATYSPRPEGPSTIGAEGLNCSVRNGKRCFPLAIATGKWRDHPLTSLENRTAPPFGTSTTKNKPSSPRTISTGLLHALPRFQIRPINLVVYQGPYSL